MADSNIKELYEFLKSYDLIQADINEEEAQNYIDAIYSSLEPDENLLTGFISNITYNGKTEPKAFFVTNQGRLLYNPLEESLNESYSLEDIDYIDEGEEDQLILKLNDNDEEILINSQDSEGIDLINDALYSSFAETLDEDQLTKIFGEEIDEEEIEEEVKPVEENEDIIVDQSTQEVEVIESGELPAVQENSIAEVEKEMVVTNTDMVKPENDLVTFTTETDDYLENAPDVAKGAAASTGAETAQAAKKGFHLTKPMKYVIGGIAILAVLAIAYFLFQYFTTTRKNNEIARELVDYFNQADEIYFACVDYQNANFAGITPEQIQEQSDKAEEIYNELNNIEPTDETDDLFQNIYFYTDSLQSTTYFGRTFLTTQNQLNRLSFDSMLDAAYRYRLTILSILRENYPDLLDQVKREKDMDLDAEYAASEENSEPSEGELARGNSESSNEAFENSTSSRENYQNSKASGN